MLAFVIVAVAGWWLASAQSFRGGAGYGADLDVGDQLHIGEAGVVDDDVSVLSVRARASEGLDVEFVVCHPSPGADLIGGVNDALDRYCSRVDPVELGTSIPALPHEPGPYLVVTLTATADGPQWLCGFDAVYRSGWRFGWQRGVGSTVLLNAEEEAMPPCDE